MTGEQLRKCKAPILFIHGGNESDHVKDKVATVRELLGVWQVLGGLVVLLPKLPRLKEWAYADILINLVAAAHHHYMAGDDVTKIAIPLVVLSIAVVSCGLRPPSRRLQGPMV